MGITASSSKTMSDRRCAINEVAIRGYGAPMPLWRVFWALFLDIAFESNRVNGRWAPNDRKGASPPALPNGPPQVVAGIKTFDGKGNLTQRDYRGDSLRTTGQTDFSTEGQETGTYTVNSDSRAAR